MCIIVPFYFRYFAVGKETFSKALGIVCGMTAWAGMIGMHADGFESTYHPPLRHRDSDRETVLIVVY